MGKIYDHFQAYLEWEIIEPEELITNLTFENGMYSLNKDCIIQYSRDSQYDLVATITGIITNLKELEPNFEKINGAFISRETITGYSPDGLFMYKLFGVVLGSDSLFPISVNTTSGRFQAELFVDRIEKSLNHIESKKTSLQEWFLCGKTEIYFPRLTSRSVDKSYKRLREGIDSDSESRLLTSRGGGRDYLLVKYADTSFIVSKVPEVFGPEWSFNLSLEYRESFGRIPEKEEREAISELVGFIFGNQLLDIGQSFYDNSSSMYLQRYQNLWGDNVMNKCQKYGLPPVEIGNPYDWGIAEAILNELITAYLKQRKPLRLEDALWKYWVAKYSSIGTNLPILSSALETLAEQIIANHPEVNSYYIEYNQFNNLIKDELISIDKKLSGNIHKEKIVNKIKGATQRGSNEKLEMMFEILNLPIGKVERKAIKSRNKMAHSAFGEKSEDEVKEIVRLTRAYETLFNRVLLKILSYNGQYVDYYTLGHPKRNIGEPIPE